MKPIKKFMKYLTRELPDGYYATLSLDGKEVTILNEHGYVYLFYKQEIEDDFESCCSLVSTVVELTR